MILMANKHILFLLDLAKKIRQVERFDNGNRLLGKISNALLHDISTPVSVLSGSYHLLKSNNLSVKDREEIDKGISRSLDEIESILHSTDFLMKSMHVKEKFSVSESVESIFRIVDGRLRKSRISLDVQLDENLVISGERNTFLRVILNVLLNAIEELEKHDRKRIVGVRSEICKKYIKIDIWDNGDGLDSNEVVDMAKCLIISAKTSCIGSGLAFVKYAMKEIFNGYLTVRWNSARSINVVSLYFDRGF